MDLETQAALEAEGAYTNDAVGDNDAEVSAVSQELAGVRASEGFLRASQPSTTSYNPTASNSYNSAGGANKVTRLGTGRYRVDMPGLAAPGNAQVTSYGSTTNRCKLHARPYAANSGVRFDVNCFTRTGTAADTLFMAFYQNSGDYDGEEAFGTVVGNTLYDGAYATTVTRFQTGIYRIGLHASLGSTGSPFVTALGSTGTYCNPFSVGPDTTGNRVVVYCFAPNGARVDADFSFLIMNQSGWSNMTSVAAKSTYSGDEARDGYYSRSRSWEQVYFDNTAPGRWTTSFYDVGVNGASIALVNANAPGEVYCVPGGPVQTLTAYNVAVSCYLPNGTAVDVHGRSVALIGRYPTVQGPTPKQ